MYYYNFLAAVSRNHSDNDVEEEEDDYEYNPDEDDWRKVSLSISKAQFSLHKFVSA